MVNEIFLEKTASFETALVDKFKRSRVLSDYPRDKKLQKQREIIVLP